jgi:peroxiredoxin Q/BCP
VLLANVREAVQKDGTGVSRTGWGHGGHDDDEKDGREESQDSRHESVTAARIAQLEWHMADSAQLQEGDHAPGFTLETDDGVSLSLDDLHGRDVVLYFYPKDDTPGCTREACAFRDVYQEMQRAGALVLGVSPDNTKSHHRFADKFDLPFPLLADPEHTVAEAYGVWKEKVNYGKRYMGIERSTFLIGKDGRIRRVWRRVKPDDHAQDVLEAVRGEA